MKILHTEASQGYGGQELRIVHEAKGMLERGHEVRLVCPPDAQIRALADRYSIPVEVLDIDRKDLAGIKAMRHVLNRYRPDVVNTHSSTDSWLVALATQLMRSRPAIVRTRHISAPVGRDPATRWLYTRSCDHIVTTGEKLRQALIGQNRFAVGHVTSVRTGIDLDVFRPGDRGAARRSLGLEESAFIVGIVATLRSWKGHRFLVDAFAQANLDHSLLLIVGDGPQWDALHERVNAAGIADRVRFTGRQDNIAQWMQALDVACLPSYANEGVPQSLMQAHACGIPAITTLVGSIDEAVIPDRTALVVEPESVDPLAAAIERMHDDSELRRRMGLEARQYALDNFSFDKMIGDMEKIFIDAVAARQRA